MIYADISCPSVTLYKKQRLFFYISAEKNPDGRQLHKKLSQFELIAKHKQES